MLYELHEVAASVIQHGEDDRSHHRRRAGELNAGGAEPLVFGKDDVFG